MVEFLQFWLETRDGVEPGQRTLGVHQRLDRDTSGVVVFSKSAEARRALAVQFEKHLAAKRYLLATRCKVSHPGFTADEPLDGKPARTRFVFQRTLSNGFDLWEAWPETGRTHQVRLHAAGHGLPIAGDSERGGETGEPLLLHAAGLKLSPPCRPGGRVSFEAPLPERFTAATTEERLLSAALALRRQLMDASETNVWRLLHRQADGFEPFTADVCGGALYVEDFQPDQTEAVRRKLFELLHATFPGTPVVYAGVDPGHPRQEKKLETGAMTDGVLTVRENGVLYRMDLLRPGAVGLFLDQRENRRLAMVLAKGKRLLNLFSYTCGFSVAAARAGASGSVNVDLSRPALEWGRENFRLNGLSLEGHAFYADDAMKVLPRLRRRGERFGVVVLDPPSSSRSKQTGHFSAFKDYGALVKASAPLVEEGGWLFCSCNLASWPAGDFLGVVEKAVQQTGRRMTQKNWMPQPFDFPARPGAPPYFKSVWLRME